MQLSPNKAGGLKADINVTPLVDVVLVLLIIFMVVTPLLKKGREVALPQAQSGAAQKELGQGDLLLTVASDGKIWLEQEVVDEERLTALAKERKRERRYLEVMVRADADVTLGQLRPVMKALKRADVTNMSFAVLKKGAP